MNQNKFILVAQKPDDHKYKTLKAENGSYVKFSSASEIINLFNFLGFEHTHDAFSADFCIYKPRDTECFGVELRGDLPIYTIEEALNMALPAAYNGPTLLGNKLNEYVKMLKSNDNGTRLLVYSLCFKTLSLDDFKMLHWLKNKGKIPIAGVSLSNKWIIKSMPWLNMMLSMCRYVRMIQHD